MLKYSHLQPSEMDKLAFYEIEQLLDDLKELNQEEEEERKKQEKHENPGMNLSSMSRQFQTPKMPTMPNFKL